MLKKAFISAAIILGIISSVFAQENNAKKFAGVWKGLLDLQGQTYSAIFTFTEKGNSLTGTAESPELGGGPVPIDNIAISGNKIEFEIAQIKGGFQGNLKEDNKTLDGAIYMGDQVYPITLTRDEKAPAPVEKKYESIWEGKLHVQGLTLRFVVKTFRKPDGSLGAIANSPDQTKADIPIKTITITDDSLKFDIPIVNGSYAGKIDKTEMTAKGVFNQRGMEMPLDLKKVEEVAEIKRPQTPVKPYPYNEEEVEFTNAKAGITLAGTLTYPKTGSNFTALVMVTGSGPQDRDETLLNHKPFLVIADYLTRNGYAVLRYDDRGVGKSKGNFAAATSADFASDALAAVEYLKGRSEINKNKIGIIGHSEGGMIAPMCAAKSKDVAFIILLAGPGVPGRDIILKQSELIARAAGAKEEDIKKTNAFNSQVYSIVMNEKDSTKALQKLDKAVDKYIASLSEKEKADSGKIKASMDAQMKQVLSPWFRFFLKYDPRKDLSRIKIPVLALNGEKDLQVYAKQNLPEIEKALKKAGNKKYKIVELPGLNHLFQTVKKGTIAEYGELEETFSPSALEVIKNWLNKL